MKNRNQLGFTLIELVVATALFAVVVTSILGVYLSSSHLDSRSRALRTVVQNGRFMMQYFEKEITNGHVDYSQPNDASNLYLINQAGEAERIYLDQNNLILVKTALPPTNINSAAINVDQLIFSLTPSVDPMTPAKAANEQPHVTVFMHLSARSARDAANLNLQDTFTELYYPSRQ